MRSKHEQKYLPGDKIRIKRLQSPHYGLTGEVIRTEGKPYVYVVALDPKQKLWVVRAGDMELTS
jgi:hypothetical protein